MPNFLAKILSAGSDKELKEFRKIVDQVNDLGPTYADMDDEELRACTPRFRERLEAGEPLDDLLPEAFAAVREASGRTLGMRHFDVQLIGGIACIAA
jgi:preprotein translocase subunit SecA